MAEVMAELPGTSYVARAAVCDPKNLMKARKMLRKAFEVQINHEGFAFVEVLSACPTNWKMTPEQATRRVREEMADYFPLGVFKEGRN